MLAPVYKTYTSNPVTCSTNKREAPQVTHTGERLEAYTFSFLSEVSSFPLPVHVGYEAGEEHLAIVLSIKVRGLLGSESQPSSLQGRQSHWK